MWVILVLAVIVIAIIGVCVAPCTHKLLHKAKEHLSCFSCLKTQEVRREESVRRSLKKRASQVEAGTLVEKPQEV